MALTNKNQRDISNNLLTWRREKPDKTNYNRKDKRLIVTIVRILVGKTNAYACIM